MKQKPTVERTANLGLCVSCGICKSVCPRNAIEMVFSKGQYLPVISDECNACGICLKICPGYEVRFEDIYRYENRQLPEDIFLGFVIDSYICYTKDKDIRKKSASGGMVTSLIVDLLKKGIYQGAFILPFEEFSTAQAKVVYSENMKQIIAASKSKYLPASIENIVFMFKDLKSPIIVGTSCQLYGIKKYCLEKNIDYSNALFLGLFCDRTLNYNILTYYQWKYGNGKKIGYFDYRNKEKDGWPGHSKLTFEDGEEVFVDRKVRMSLKKYFQLKRCLFCIDKLNQLADISLGDCYIKGEESELGQSNIFIRTEKGKQALEAVKDNFVLKQVAPSLVAGSQKIKEKQQNLHHCYLLEQKYNHIVYPVIQQQKADMNLNTVEKRYNDSLSSIYLGSTTSKFSQIDKQARSEKIKKTVRRLVGLVARKVGVKK